MRFVGSIMSCEFSVTHTKYINCLLTGMNTKADNKSSVTRRHSHRLRAGVNPRLNDFVMTKTQTQRRMKLSPNKSVSTDVQHSPASSMETCGAIDPDQDRDDQFDEFQIEPGGCSVMVRHNIDATCTAGSNTPYQELSSEEGVSPDVDSRASCVESCCATCPNQDSDDQSGQVQTDTGGCLEMICDDIDATANCTTAGSNSELICNTLHATASEFGVMEVDVRVVRVENDRQYVTFVNEDGTEFQVDVETVASCDENAPCEDRNKNGTCADDAGNDNQEVTESKQAVDDTDTVGLHTVPRTSRPGIWKRNIAKKCRNSGQQYTTNGSIRAMKCLKPNPCRKCQHGCADWTPEQRHKVFEDYWKLSHQQKRDWINAHTELKYAERKKGDTKRQYTVKYWMERDDKKNSVCRQFFLATLDIGKRLVHYTILNRMSGGTAKPDQRGRHNPKNKTASALEHDVITYISTLPAVPSHYCRSQSSRKYLPVEFRNLSFLYSLYKKDCESKNKNYVTKAVFTRIFQKQFNIGFHLPKKDKCVTCERFKNTPEDMRTEVTKQSQIEHEVEKNATLREHISDQNLPRKDESVVCCSFDLQAVLSTPRSDSVLLFYARKYATYNFTVYESVSRRGNCYIWGESDGGRGSHEIATCLHKYLMSLDSLEDSKIKHVVMYCDCCPGQNRNRVVLAMLKYTLTITTSITDITLKFLLPGHTYMPADSMHATIERFTKRRAIWAPSQWAQVIGLARTDPKPYNVTVMKHTDFLLWSSVEKMLPRQLKDTEQNNVKWLSIRSIHLVKGQDDATVRFNFVDTNEITMPLATANRRTRKKSTGLETGQPPQPISAYSGKLSISAAKYKDLKLCDRGIIPADYRNEYLSLPVDDDVADCLPETDAEDDVSHND